MIYLASPYWHEDPMVRYGRFTLCNIVAMHLMQEHTVFSPISHSHPINEQLIKMGGRQPSWEFWSRQDLPILGKCDKMVVIDIPAWEQSHGVGAEIAYCVVHNIPIEFLDPRDIKAVDQWLIEIGPTYDEAFKRMLG